MKIRLGVVVLLLALVGMPLFAQESAVLKQFTGKVQLKAQGADWVDATAGAVVSKGTFISTGFNSTAVLDLGTSQVQVKQLTRMRLDELLRNANAVTTSLFLTVGSVRANVDNTAGLTQNFKLTSPVSTAAVRGTEFDYDGAAVSVIHGIVAFSNALALSVNVSGGQASQLQGNGAPASVEVAQAQAAIVVPQTTAPSSGVTVTAGRPSSQPTNTGTINVTLM